MAWYKNLLMFCRRYQVVLLGLGLAVFMAGMWCMRTYMTNFDERDHLAVGYFMYQGKDLYKDIFSHHFPLPYAWVEMFGRWWIDVPASRGVSIFRMSLAVYYAIGLVLGMVALRTCMSRVKLLLVALSSMLLMPLFHGNLLLSETFGYWPVFIMIMIIMLNKHKSDIRVREVVILATLSLFAFWSQPLLIAGFVLAGFYARFRLKLFIGLSAVGMTIPLWWMMMSGTLHDFLEQAVWFNWVIYPKYYTDVSVESTTIWSVLTRGVQDFVNSGVINWILMGQIIGSVAILWSLWIRIRAKKWTSLIVLLLALALVLLRWVKIEIGVLFNFGIWPLMILMLIMLWQGVWENKGRAKIVSAGLLGIFLFCWIVAGWPIWQSLTVPGYNYHVFWSNRALAGQEIASLTEPSDPILVYPHDVDIYYFAKRQLPDRFVYWFPWINDVAKYREERSTMLNNSRPSLIYMGTKVFRESRLDYSNIYPDITVGMRLHSVNEIDGAIWLTD
jgi:hypothetical protein